MSLEQYRREFETLPAWAKSLVLGLAKSPMYGWGHDDLLMSGLSKDTRDRCSPFFLVLDDDARGQWREGFDGLKSLSEAMTAPWPPPTPEPHKKMTTSNVVEILALGGQDDCAFDQPCHYGHRVESHAVYCHNDAWPDSPRKCHRNRRDFKHEDCPGFYPNAAQP